MLPTRNWYQWQNSSSQLSLEAKEIWNTKWNLAIWQGAIILLQEVSNKRLTCAASATLGHVACLSKIRRMNPHGRQRSTQLAPGIPRQTFCCTCRTTENEAEEFFQLDTFHLVKVGLGRDLCGSGILVLARLGLYDWEGCTSKTLSDRLQRAHQSFSLWCAGCKCKPGLRSFTKQFLNIQSKKSFAWMNTKGSDTMMVIRYLKWFAGIELIAPSTKKAEENQKIMRLLKHTTDNLLQAFSIIHGHGLWLDRPCGKLLYTCFMVTLRGYKSLAKHALQLQLCGFAFKPKFHGLHHVAYKLRLDLLAGNQRVLNPVCWMCEQDEDKVGKISRLSRRISVRNQTSQILYRYMLKKKSCLARSKEECKHRKWQNTSRSWAGVMESHLASKVALGMPRS